MIIYIERIISIKQLKAQYIRGLICHVTKYASRQLWRLWVAGALMLTACGGASVPDKYNYDDFSKYVKLGKYKNLEYTS